MFLQWLEFTGVQELVHVRQIKCKRKFCYTNELTVVTGGDCPLVMGGDTSNREKERYRDKKRAGECEGHQG